MKISFAITVCDEYLELQRLITHLLQYKREEDEIIVLFDKSKENKEVEEYLKESLVDNKFKWYKGKFEGHFGDWKNKLNSLCDGDIIFQIDADEVPNEYLIRSLPYLIKDNPEIDVYLVPRENFVNGITQEHIQKWGWKVDEQGRINPWDYQWRVYKNTPTIRWTNKVHEILEGFKKYTYLPPQTEWSLLHVKDIERQEKQNNYYNSL
jgi:glycosyltransferase involved in cell wall biosynthesis